MKASHRAFLDVATCVQVAILSKASVCFVLSREQRPINFFIRKRARFYNHFANWY
jgi:hypothetical protein